MKKISEKVVGSLQSFCVREVKENKKKNPRKEWETNFKN